MREVSHDSWGSRIGKALLGVLVGIALVIGSLVAIFWNESHSLNTAKSLQQAQKITIAIPASPIDPKNNLRVVYLSALANTDDILEDKIFGVSEKALRLNREVEMYQWQENVETTTEKNVGGSEDTVKTYSYDKVWSKNPIDSSKFKEKAEHQNPAVIPVKAKVVYANKVTLGDFILPKAMLEKISGEHYVDLSKADLATLNTKYKKTVTQSGDGLYFGNDENNPSIGDMRVTVSSIFPETISIVAQQINNTFQAYRAPAGEDVSLIEMGQLSSDQLYQNAADANKQMTWVIRFVTLFLIFLGFVLILNPLSVLADVIPFIGSMVSFGTGLIALIGGLTLWSIATAIAWFSARPIIAASLLVGCFVICLLLYLRGKSKKARA